MTAMALTCGQLNLSSHYCRPRLLPLSRFPLPVKPILPASCPLRVPFHNCPSRARPIAASQTEPSDLFHEDRSRIGGFERRRKSQLPPRLQKLTRPLPAPPNYYLWAAVIVLLFITRDAVANELIQWATIAAATGLALIRSILGLLVDVLRYAVHLLHAPLAFVLTFLGWAGLFTRDMYSLIVSTTSVWPTLQALILGTAVLSIGEATRSTAVSGQPWSFVIVTLLGVGAVFEILHSAVFVFLLLLSVIYALLVQKKDAVSAFLPGTALLVAMAEPPVQAVALASFLALSIYTNWKNLEKQAELVEDRKKILQPTIMVVAAMALGLTVASQYLSIYQLLWLAKSF